MFGACLADCFKVGAVRLLHIQLGSLEVVVAGGTAALGVAGVTLDAWVVIDGQGVVVTGLLVVEGDVVGILTALRAQLGHRLNSCLLLHSQDFLALYLRGGLNHRVLAHLVHGHVRRHMRLVWLGVLQLGSVDTVHGCRLTLMGYRPHVLLELARVYARVGRSEVLHESVYCFEVVLRRWAALNAVDWLSAGARHLSNRQRISSYRTNRGPVLTTTLLKVDTAKCALLRLRR